MDESLLLWINHGWAGPWLDTLFTWLSQRNGFAFPLLGLILVLMAIRFRGDGVKLWLLLAAVVGIADFTGDRIKHLTHQPRPCYAIAGQVRTPGFTLPRPCGADLDAMPSNHATNYFAAAVFLTCVLRIRWISAALLLLALCVSLSRIYLGKHYPSQVAAGMVLGTAVGFAAAWTSVKYLAFIQRIRARPP